MDILRTLLFVPGNRERMLERGAARTAPTRSSSTSRTPCRASEKRAARTLVAQRCCRSSRASRQPVFVRVNDVRSGPRPRRRDGASCGRGWPASCIPKTERAAGPARPRRAAARGGDEVQGAARRHRHDPADREPAWRCCAARRSRAASDRVVALSLGGEDYTRRAGRERDAAARRWRTSRGVIVHGRGGVRPAGDRHAVRGHQGRARARRRSGAGAGDRASRGSTSSIRTRSRPSTRSSRRRRTRSRTRGASSQRPRGGEAAARRDQLDGG